jgi:hypothetical protein
MAIFDRNIKERLNIIESLKEEGVLESASNLVLQEKEI